MSSSTSLNSRIVPAVLEWMFEQDDRVYVVFAINVNGSSLTPEPSAPYPTNDVTVNGAGKPFLIKLLRLNVSSEATSGFVMSDEGLIFKCRFSGQVIEVVVPYNSVVRLECPARDFSYNFDFEMLVEDRAIEPIEEKKVETVKAPRPNLTLVK